MYFATKNSSNQATACWWYHHVFAKKKKKVKQNRPALKTKQKNVHAKWYERESSNVTPTNDLSMAPLYISRKNEPPRLNNCPNGARGYMITGDNPASTRAFSRPKKKKKRVHLFHEPNKKTASKGVSIVAPMFQRQTSKRVHVPLFQRTKKQKYIQAPLIATMFRKQTKRVHSPKRVNSPKECTLKKGTLPERVHPQKEYSRKKGTGYTANRVHYQSKYIRPVNGSAHALRHPQKRYWHIFFTHQALWLTVPMFRRQSWKKGVPFSRTHRKTTSRPHYSLAPMFSTTKCGSLSARHTLQHR